MNHIYTQDIAQWATKVEHAGYNDLLAPTVSRRSSISISSSEHLGSPALSAVSYQSSATSLSSGSFTAADHGADCDVDVAGTFDLCRPTSDQTWEHFTQSSSQAVGNDDNIATDSEHTFANNSQEGVYGGGRTYRPNVIPSISSLPRPKHDVLVSFPQQTCRNTGIESLLEVESRYAQPSIHTGVPRRNQVNLKRQQISQRPPITQPNPRRTSTGQSWTRPNLVRQEGRREDFVTHLVECAATLVSHIWPTSGPTPSSQPGHCIASSTITLSFFIQETLRRSRSTYSTLQVTLYYLYLVKAKGNVPSCGNRQSSVGSSRAMSCGRRMFLSALILASKFLQDRNYSNKAWSKITSLPVQEINAIEKLFLAAIDYSLFVSVDTYNRWCAKVQACVESASGGRPCQWSDVFAAMDNDKPLLTVPDHATPQVVSSHGLVLPDIHSSSPSPELDVSTSSNNLPPSPTLSRTLTTPTVSPWAVNGITPAASFVDSNASPMSVSSAATGLTRSGVILARSRLSRRTPSPLRAVTSHLPTPTPSPASVKGTTVVGSPMSYLQAAVKHELDENKDTKSVSANIAHRVATEAHKHGLNNFCDMNNISAPHTKALTVNDSFTDSSLTSNECMRGNLPALTEVLRWGLDDYLKPSVQYMRQNSMMTMATCVKGTKRGCDETHNLNRLSKAARSSTWH